MRAAQIFSLDAWRRLSAEERSKLTAMLPESCQESEADVEHVLQTELFSLQPRRFGAHLARFWNDLKAGAYSAASLAAAERADAERARAHTSLRRHHHNALVHKLHQLRRTWKPRAPRAPSKSSGGGGKASDQVLYDKQSGGLVRRTKQGGLGAPLGRPSLGDARGSSSAPSLPGGVGGGAADSGDGGGGVGGSMPGPPSGPPSTPGDPSGLLPPFFGGASGGGGGVDAGEDDEASVGDGVSSNAGDMDQMASGLGGSGGLGSGGLKRPRSGDGSGGGRSPLGLTPNPYFDRDAASAGGDDNEDGGCPAELRFFELVRDAISSVQQELAPEEYVRKAVTIQAQASGMVSKLPRGTNLGQYLRSVLQFMATPAKSHAARTARSAAIASGEAPNEPPPSALVQLDGTTQSFRWIAAPDASSNASLRRFEALHYEQFLSQHGGVVGSVGGMRGMYAAPRAQKNTLTLPPGSAEQLAAFRAEEERRYASPEAPFTFTLRDGSRSCVAPLRKSSSKAREHFLLENDRPAGVTLLSLVRDAAARLPGGEGSRTDVCELLKESAHVISSVNDAQITSAASGALDRLQSEADPPVRYDAERKLWIYLHGSRSEADFAAVPHGQQDQPADDMVVG